METKYLVAIIIATLLILLNGGFLIYFCIIKRKNTTNETKCLKNQSQTELSNCTTNHKQTTTKQQQIIDKTSQLNSVISDRKILSSSTLMPKEEHKQCNDNEFQNVDEISGNECNISVQERNNNTNKRIIFAKESNCFNSKDEYDHSKCNNNYIDFQESKNDLNECNTNNMNSIMNDDYNESSNNNVAPDLESEIKKQIEQYILDYDEKQLIKELQSKPSHLNIN